MKMRLLHMLAILLLLLGSQQAWAQVSVIKGTVTDKETGQSIPGANVVIKGTTKGTVTDLQGVFTLQADANATLVFSFIGYKNQEAAIAGRSAVDVALVSDAQELSEVVVTAFGIEKEKKALGYSVSEVKGADLAVVREPNLTNALAGKVAGVQISQTASGAAGSSRVVIRGASSLTGNNQVLYVVDGIPVDNSSAGQSDRWGNSVDYGSGISDLNPEDVESMSVLKGPNASALYGSRGANGVILITTKKGKSRKGLGVSFNSNNTFESIMLHPEVQTTYGQGVQGVKNLESPASWGSKLDGSAGYSDQGDRYKEFYQVGYNVNNAIAIDGGSDNTQFRLSYTNVMNEGIVPNSTLKRNALSLRLSSKLHSRVDFDGKVNYINNRVNNRPYLAVSPANTAYALAIMPANISLSNYAREWKNPTTGEAYRWSGATVNPYYAVNEPLNEDERHRFISFGSLKFDIMKELKLLVRTGLDYSNTQLKTIANKGHFVYGQGRIANVSAEMMESNSDFLFMFNKKLSNSFNLELNAGGNYRYNRSFTNTTAGSTLLAGLPSVNVGNLKEANTYLSEKVVSSLYMSGQVGYLNSLFLDFSARNDWSSALPTDNRSFFYPSVTASAVVNELFNIDSKALSFLKVRAGWAKVGNDTDPYNLKSPYIAYMHGSGAYLAPGINAGFESGEPGAVLANSGLLPEEKTSLEFGIDARFFNDRLGLDVTYYDAVSRNQIISMPIASSSGYSSKFINAGEIKNKGIELSINATPIKTDKITWDATLHFTKNMNEVASLYQDLETFQFPGGAAENVSVEARVGAKYGAIVGKKYLRDAQGRIVVDAAGIPMAEQQNSVLGSFLPEFMAGFRNSVTYKNFTLTALIDGRFGGEIFSIGDANMDTQGTSIKSLQGREGGLLIPNSVTQEGKANTTRIPASDLSNYYNTIYGTRGIIEDYVYDATNVRLREVSLSYNLPASMLKGTPFGSVRVGYVGRNLFFLYNSVENFDPEAANYTNTNVQGVEAFTLPATRSHGFNVSLTF